MKRNLFAVYQQANPEDSGAAAPPASEPASNEVIADVDWGSVSTETPGIDDPYDDANPPEESPPADETTAAPEPTPPAETPPVAAPSVPAAPPAAPPAPQPPAAPPPELVAKEQEELQKKILSGLEERYRGQISEEDARELAINPEKVMPRLMAQAVMDAVTSMQGMLQQQLPKAVEETTRTVSVRQAAAKEFFSANPDLAKPEYKSVLDQAAAIYRSTHPNAKRADMVTGVAKIARVTLGLPEPSAAPAPAPAPKSTRPAAFVPVAAGGSSRPGPSSGKAKTVWDDLID